MPTERAPGPAPDTGPPAGAALHLLMAWSAASYPTGAFAYSHGLEAEISAGRVTDRATLTDWLAGVLRFGAGRSDAALLTQAWQAASWSPESDAGRARDLEAISAVATALAPSSERLLETTETGRAFAAVTAAVLGGDATARPLPVAFGAAAAQADLPLEATAQAYLHGFAANLVSAAQRFMPMGQTDGQRVMVALYPIIDAVARDATQDPRLGSAALAADLAAMTHETLPVRIFRS